MNEKLEQNKIDLHITEEMIDIKGNPVVDSILVQMIRSIPCLGSLIGVSTDMILENFQQKKKNELIETILKDRNTITFDMVNDVEFIVNFARVMEAVQKLATNDKIKYFGNLIRNGYLSGEHIQNSEFEEYLDVLNTMSYREIEYLIDYKVYCEQKARGKQVKYNTWPHFRRDYADLKKISESELCSIFMRIKRTGFIEEEYETESGGVNEHDNSFNPLQVDSSGFCINSSFHRFFDMVLKMERA